MIIGTPKTKLRRPNSRLFLHDCKSKSGGLRRTTHRRAGGVTIRLSSLSIDSDALVSIFGATLRQLLYSRFAYLDWLREKVYFDGLQKRDTYCVSRLGFKAPNIFIVQLLA